MSNYNPVIHTGGKIKSRATEYNRDVIASDTTIKAKTSYISGSKILSGDNGVEFDNQSSPKLSIFRQGGGISVAASPSQFAVFGGPNSPPNGVMTLAALRVSPPKLPDFNNRECEEGISHPDQACYICKGGKYFHISKILDAYDPRRGCGVWFEDNLPVGPGKFCAFKPIIPDGACELCEFGNIINNCYSDCQKCVNGRCVDTCPANHHCIDGKCYLTCDASGLNCRPEDCRECVTKVIKIGTDLPVYIPVCASRCGTGETCNGKGLCVGKCWPPCSTCEDCVNINGFYGCKSLTESDCETTSVCCDGQIISYKTACERLGPNCTVVNNCAPDEACEGTLFWGPGRVRVAKKCYECLKSCTGPGDCDDNNCFSCTGAPGDPTKKVCIDTCGQGYFCRGDGTCQELKCNGCEQLRAKDCGDKPKNNLDCWECVNVCDELSTPDIKLECAPDNDGTTVSCQYIPPGGVGIASMIP